MTSPRPAPKILVVEDDPLMRKVISEVLRAAFVDWEIDETHSGVDALTALRAGIRPDLVLSDIVLGDMSGTTLFQSAVNEGHCWNFVFLTGLAQREVLVRAVSSGAMDYLLKPFEPAQLVEKLRGHMREALREAPLVEQILSGSPEIDEAAILQQLSPRIRQNHARWADFHREARLAAARRAA